MSENISENIFDKVEVLNNQAWNKTLANIDSFYINSALVSVYNKKGAEFINIRDSVRKMYSDIYEEKIKLPEIVDDSWTSVTLARYIEKDIKLFESSKLPKGEFVDKEVINKVLNFIKDSDIKINYEGLSVSLNLKTIENISYNVKIVTTLRGKLCSSFNLTGREIEFQGITAPAKNLQRHEVLTLKEFITVYIGDKKVNITVSKIGDQINKIFVSDEKYSSEYNFEDYDISWGSFDINRGV